MQNDEAYFHTPVLLQEVIDYLNVKPGKRFIDATLGGGGHTKEIIRSGGEVLGIDQDPQAIEYVRQHLHMELPAGLAGCFTLVRGNFKDIALIAQRHEFTNVDGIIMDLGVSSFHLNASKRGFTFRRDEPLDMRMDPLTKISASDIINSYPERKLYEIFARFGEIQLAEQLANHIAVARGITPITTTGQLVSLIEQLMSHRPGKIHPATLVFQALRIETNQEFKNLKEGLAGAIEILAPKGRLVVISFHSGEDRIVKLFMRNEEVLEPLFNDPLRPTENEIATNSRARSARLRVAEKII